MLKLFKKRNYKNKEIKSELDYINYYTDKYIECIKFKNEYNNRLENFVKQISLALFDIIKAKGKRKEINEYQHYGIQIENITEYKIGNIEILCGKYIHSSKITEYFMRVFFCKRNSKFYIIYTKFIEVHNKNSEIEISDVGVYVSEDTIKFIVKTLTKIYNLIVYEMKNNISIFSEKSIVNFIKIANKNDKFTVMNTLKKTNKKLYLVFLRR